MSSLFDQGVRIMFVAVRDLWFARGRFLLMAGVVALVAVLVVMLSGLTAGLAAQNTSAVDALGAERIVFAESPDGPSYTGSRLDGGAVAAWTSRTDVAAALLGIGRATLVGNGSAPVVAFATDPASFVAPAGLAPGTIVVSQPVAAELGVATGDSVTLGDRSLTVAVGAADVSFAHSPVVWTALEDWRALGGGVNVLALDGSPDGPPVAGTVVLPVGDTYGAIGSFSAENGSLQMIRGFLLVISALVIGAFFTVWTIQRRHDVAVLKAMGASTRYLLVDALGQAALVLVGAATFGGAVGLLAGAVVSSSVPFVSTPATLVAPLALMVGVGLLGAALAVRSITTVDPLDALGGAR